MIRIIKDRVLDFIYPPNIYCIYCNKPIDDSLPYSICGACVRMIHWANKSTCGKCGKPMEDKTLTTGDQLCSDCKETKRDFDKGFTCVSYGLMEKTLIHRLKYGDKSYLFHHMARLMYERIALEDLMPHLVAPVPMYKRKERRRGYNQAGLLSRHISRELGVPDYPDLLIRNKDTKAMSSLGPHQREENIRDVFYTEKWVQNIVRKKTVLLVDDVFTTGSTVNGCSRVLKEAGAHKVYVLTFAAGADGMWAK